MGTCRPLARSHLFPSSFPSEGGGGVHARDAFAHLIEYAILGGLLYRALGRIGLSVLLAAAYGASDEIHQLFVMGRTAQPADWLFDAIGALAGVVITRSLASRPPHVRPDE